MPLFFTALTVLAALGVLLAERRGSQRGKWLAKPVAGLSFVALALASGALGSSYGRIVLAALVLSLAGDILLVPKGTGWPFRLGMLTFLLAHVAYVTAFSSRATLSYDSAARALVCIGLCGGAAIPLVRRAPHKLRVPVAAYALALASMVATASITNSTHIATAAVLFLASDVFVGLNRFTTPSFLWKVLAVPLYYGAQIVFATSVS